MSDMKRLCIRIKAVTLGGHVHLGLWVGLRERMPENPLYSDLGKAGDLVLRREEWEAFRDQLQSQSGWLVRINEEEDDRTVAD